MRSNKNPLSFLGVCSGLGQTQAGLELAPALLREHGVIDELRGEVLMIKDRGDIHPGDGSPEAPWDLIARVRTKASGILKERQDLLVIGGDHSIAIGTVQATLEIAPSARVVWVDAHGDINTPFTSVTGNLHGMPLAALLGLFDSPIGGPRLAPDNLILIGVRDLDPPEMNFLAELKIEVVTAAEIAENSPRSLDRIKEFLARSPGQPIHLSFDVDAIDPDAMPATGLRRPDGLSVSFACDTIRTARENGPLMAADLVELNPLKANSERELATSLATASVLLKASFGTL